MSTLPFREHHLLSLLEEYDRQTLPMDLVIHRYFRSHKALGSKDRAYLAETAYAMMRWKGLLDYLCPKPGWEKRLLIFQKFAPKEYIHEESIAPYIRVSFPQELYEILVQNYGEKKAQEICLISNTQAPITVRANLLKTTRDELLARWTSEGYPVEPCKLAPQGIIFKHRLNFFTLPEFKQGLFEVQDEGSQLVASLVNAHPGDHIMDYCSGSGGKSLAFAPAMQNTGQLYIHDIRNSALREARIRLKRAGIQNGQMMAFSDPKLTKLKKKMDWIIVDAPCTGTGTYRRHPDMKWRFSCQTLQRLRSEQRVIFEKALSFKKPEGKIVYATCSLLREENQDQVEHFIKTYSLEMEEEPFQSLPSIGGMDGFYAVVLKSSHRV